MCGQFWSAIFKNGSRLEGWICESQSGNFSAVTSKHVPVIKAILVFLYFDRRMMSPATQELCNDKKLRSYTLMSRHRVWSFTSVTHMYMIGSGSLHLISLCHIDLFISKSHLQTLVSGNSVNLLQGNQQVYDDNQLAEVYKAYFGNINKNNSTNNNSAPSSAPSKFYP